MIRRLAAVAVLVALPATRIRGQMPLITVPRGTVRIDLAGSLNPNDQIWVNGDKRPLGSTLEDGSAMVLGVSSRLGQVLGHDVSGLTIGSITGIAAREHGVGNIGLAWSLTRHITVFGTIPIIFVRTRVAIADDVATANVGVNPGHAVLGTDAGRLATAQFLSDFGAALDALTARIQNGDFATNPAALALANSTVTSGKTMRSNLAALLGEPLLPTSTGSYGTELGDRITALQSALSDSLGVTGFAAPVPLPTTSLTSDQFNTVLRSPGGFNFGFRDNLPRYTLGDMELGVAVQLAERGMVGSRSWSAAWARLTARFPNGAAANPAVLLDQAAGNEHPVVQLDAIGEMGHGRIGVRGELSYQHALPWNTLKRVTTPELAFVPPSFLAAVRSQPGDSMVVALHPFVGFAQHLALAATVEYWRKSKSHTHYVAGQAPIDGVDPSELDVGSAADALVLGIGLSYVHDGRRSDGSSGLPVEASWSIERTVTSGLGIFPVALTSRMGLRIYRPLGKR